MLKKIALWFFVVVFLFFTGVQYNDPDPYIWMPTYLIVVFLCYHKLQGKGDKMLYFIAGLIYLMWAGNQFPPEWEGVLLNQGMKTINIELGRESLGLGCCTIALWVCAALK